MLDIALWTGGAAIALFALDRLFLWMEARGWIYWRKVKSKSSGGDILTGFGFSDPGTRHLEEARREHVLEDEEDSDDDGQRKKFRPVDLTTSARPRENAHYSYVIRPTGA